MSACTVRGVFSNAGCVCVCVGGVVYPDGPRPLRRQDHGGTPVLELGEASRWLQQRGNTAGGR